MPAVSRLVHKYHGFSQQTAGFSPCLPSGKSTEEISSSIHDIFSSSPLGTFTFGKSTKKASECENDRISSLLEQLSQACSVEGRNAVASTLSAHQEPLSSHSSSFLCEQNNHLYFNLHIGVQKKAQLPRS